MDLECPFLELNKDEFGRVWCQYVMPPCPYREHRLGQSCKNLSKSAYADVTKLTTPKLINALKHNHSSAIQV
jgi:predicted metal-binding transcription factor (methanogenesis marker protein 9)